MSLLMFGLGAGEIFLILVIVLLLFGASRIPKIARSMGKSVGEFKKGLREGGQDETPKEDEEKPEKE